MTSSTKPVVHNVSQRHKRRIEPRPQTTHTENSVKLSGVVLRYANGQTDRQTYNKRGKILIINYGPQTEVRFFHSKLISR